MKSLSKLNKTFSAFLTFAFVAVVTAGVSVASAQSVLETVFPTTFLRNGRFDIGSIIGLVFQVILYAAVLWTVWNVVLAGIKIAGAKEDADKRKEGIQAVINAVIGLVVALLAFGIVSTVTNLIGANLDRIEVTNTPCVAQSSNGTTFSGFISRENASLCVNNNVTPTLSGTIPTPTP